MKTFDIQSLPESIVVNVAGSSITRYPTLSVEGNTVSVVVVDHPQAAAMDLHHGVARLLQQVFHRDLVTQVRHLPGLNQTKLYLGRRLQSSQLEDGLALLLINLGILNQSPQVRTKDDFELLKIRAYEKISMAASEVGRWLTRFGDAYHKVALILEASKLPPAVEQDVRAQLNWLLQADFLNVHTWELLKEMPRYLQAIEHRLRKVTTGESTLMQKRCKR